MRGYPDGVDPGTKDAVDPTIRERLGWISA